jgi:hypothetical protein
MPAELSELLPFSSQCAIYLLLSQSVFRPSVGIELVEFGPLSPYSSFLTRIYNEITSCCLQNFPEACKNQHNRGKIIVHLVSSKKKISDIKKIPYSQWPISLYCIKLLLCVLGQLFHRPFEHHCEENENTFEERVIKVVYFLDLQHQCCTEPEPQGAVYQLERRCGRHLVSSFSQCFFYNID